MNRCLVDTNILLRCVDASHPQHNTAIAAVKLLIGQGKELCLTGQNLIEFWAVATRPTTANGLGLTPDQAALEISHFKAAFQLLADSPAVLGEWERITTTYSVIGKQAHDARLVALMKTYGIGEILTFNIQDFTRYAGGEGITVLNPESVPSALATGEAKPRFESDQPEQQSSAD